MHNFMEYFMLILGLDVGIASVGWGLIDTEKQVVVDAGVWMHEAPEDKTQTGTKLRSEARRTFRGQRRVIRRRRQRMADIRRLFVENGLLATADRDALRASGLDPWRLRVAALERRLTPFEFAIALGHVARHRGFKSNSKKAGGNESDDGKMLKAAAHTREKLAKFVTPARTLLEDEEFVRSRTMRKDGGIDVVRRLRNREGDYSRSLLRDDLDREVHDIFAAQRRLGASFAEDAFEQRFRDIAFFQRPLQDSEHMVGPCPFGPAEMRTARRGLSFEKFRFLSRLNNLRLSGRDNHRLSQEEIAGALADFGATATISFANLRKKLGLPATVEFVGIKAEEEGKRDVVARSGSAAAGTARLRKLIAGAHGEMTWLSLSEEHPEVLDRAAEVISFRSDIDSIRKGLSETALPPDVQATLVEAAAAGDLEMFSGAGHISAKAARKILPGLIEGLTYDAACGRVGYDHTASREHHAFDTGMQGKEALAKLIKEERISRELVGSPTARKALIEALKQVKAIVEKYELPGRIHVELARDVGKSIEEREEIDRGIERRNTQKDKLRALFAETVGRPVREGQPGAEELLRFELWEQQGGRCLYTDSYISPTQLIAEDNSVQVDHILPWSRFGDDSFHNKTLCLAEANQKKRGNTPYEWFMRDRPDEWEAFVARVKSIPYMKGMKRRNYLLQDADAVVEKFRERSLNDTRWSCRLFAEALRQVLPDIFEGRTTPDGKRMKTRRVFARPGALTDHMRRAWGLQFFKKAPDGKRLSDDRHHAMDALILAGITESVLNRATREIQEIEAKGFHYDLAKKMPPPWPGFREQVLAVLEQVFVARAPRARARGKAHDATIRQIGEKDGQEIVYERKRVADLKKEDLARIKSRERSPALVASLEAWIEAGKPKDKPPLSPKGDPIGKIRLETKGKVAIRLHRGGPENPAGTVDRGEMARVDVFVKATPKGVRQFFLVPIYPHEIATLDAPPRRAVAAYKPESEWPVMDETYQFLWSLVPMTLLRIVDKSATPFFAGDEALARAAQADPHVGYFRGLDRATGAIMLSSVADQTWVKTGVGARTLVQFQKLAVDRLGRFYDVKPETRTWHGKACI